MEITVRGITTHVEIFEGAQQSIPFLVLHGWGSNSERWQIIAEELAAKGHKVIVPDLPGFGKSQMLPSVWTMNDYIHWLEEFIKVMHLKEFYLAGHSFGGALAAKLTIQHPQEVKKLFLLSSACVRKRTAKKSFFKHIAKVGKLLSFLPKYELLRKAFYKVVIRRSDYMYVQGVMKETYLKVIAEDLSQFTGFIKIPTVIIWGDKDTATPIEDAYFLHERIRNSQLIVLPGQGHDINRKCPEVVAEKILASL